jgi:hypothetical protein
MRPHTTRPDAGAGGLIGRRPGPTLAAMIALLRAVGAAAAVAMMVLPATAFGASERCGTVGSGYERLHVRIVSGNVSCREARRVMRIAVGDGGAHIGNWTCDGGAGGVGCLRRSPRARILGTV